LKTGAGTALNAITTAGNYALKYDGTVETITDNGKVDSFDMNAGFFKDKAGNAGTASKNNAYGDVIDLGTDSLGISLGNLIAPIVLNESQVYGGPKVFYFWDRNGDERYTAPAVADAIYNGNNTNTDKVSHNNLDGIFTQTLETINDAGPLNSSSTVQSNTLNPDASTTDLRRYANLNGVNAALPTVDHTQATRNSSNGQYVPTNGNTGNQGSATKGNDISAVWDAYNSTTGTGYNSNPGPYRDGYLWSATPLAGSPDSHWSAKVDIGNITSQTDDKQGNWSAIFQVL
jgi:hypothetical protein